MANKSVAFVGVDPGSAGSVAVIYEDTEEIRFYDTPTYQVKVGKKMRNRLNTAGMAAIFRNEIIPSADKVYVAIEKVNAMPAIAKQGENGVMEERRSMGATSAFAFGEGFGMWQGIVAALLLPYELVHPATWKKLLLYGEAKGKDASRQKACQLFPQAEIYLKRKKDADRAEALLIAHWARIMHGSPASAPKTVEEGMPLFRQALRV